MQRILSFIASSLILAVSAGLTVSCKYDSLLRPTAQGPVYGTRSASGDMLIFRGIPYAAPPVGERRFAPPRPPAKRSGVLKATEFGPSCAQAAGVMGAASTAEDCLYLNIYTPARKGRYPVMVWIHGGAFIAGSGSDAYLPDRLVAEGVVVVTLNYRLGALGFLAHPALSAEQGGRSGAYGLLDQRMALKWVQQNIEYFGGDPDNVTIFGESAGGHSVMALIASPKTDGLFHKAIVQSGSIFPEQIPLATAEQLGAAAFAACADVDCLRELTVEEVLAAQSRLSSGIGLVVNHGSALQPDGSIADALASGSFQRVPLLAGTNLDEYTLFVGISALSNSPPPPERYLAEIGALIRQPADSAATRGVAAAYPLTAYGDNVWQAIAAIGTDVAFACNALRQAQQLAPYISVHAYEFADREAPLTLLPVRPAGIELGAMHAAEIPYLFGSDDSFIARGASAAQVALSQAMIRYWTRFARNGDPNGASDPLWPDFNSTGQLLQLNQPASALITAAAFSAQHRCAIWTP
jgi:para-nitrobenzyl esterase